MLHACTPTGWLEVKPSGPSTSCPSTRWPTQGPVAADAATPPAAHCLQLDAGASGDCKQNAADAKIHFWGDSFCAPRRDTSPRPEPKGPRAARGDHHPAGPADSPMSRRGPQDSPRGPRRLTKSSGPAAVGFAHTRTRLNTHHTQTHTTRQHTTPNTKLLMKHMQTQQIKTLLLRCPFHSTTAHCFEKCTKVCSGVGPYLAARAALKRGGQRGHIGNWRQGGGAALYGVRNNVIAVRGGASLVRFAAARPRLHASARQPQQPPAPTLPWDGGQKNKKLTAL